ncbi:hypothetical protein B9Z55_023542 [Caenorhabditis nigoni]|uniref:Uncharacterized protein n=1 Tax=Caenorhabditis nigoni TaxID=1611254 RepID=A0A2G5SQ51_9PELO|nr:hypothetical protein B9Z55_023542 [Caenorhabditis nigoni]
MSQAIRERNLPEGRESDEEGTASEVVTDVGRNKPLRQRESSGVQQRKPMPYTWKIRTTFGVAIEQRSDHTRVQRQKELIIVSQAVTTSKVRVCDSSRTRSNSHLVRGAEVDVQQSLKDEQCATTEAIHRRFANNKPSDVRSPLEIQPNEAHNYRSHSLEDVPSQRVSHRQKDATCHYKTCNN